MLLSALYRALPRRAADLGGGAPDHLLRARRSCTRSRSIPNARRCQHLIMLQPARRGARAGAPRDRSTRPRRAPLRRSAAPRCLLDPAGDRRRRVRARALGLQRARRRGSPRSCRPVREPVKKRLELVDAPLPGVVARPSRAAPRRAARAAAGSAEQPRERAADATPTVGSRRSGSSRRRRRSRGCRARRCRRPRRRSAIASSGGRQKPSCVEVWTNTVASLKSSLTSSSLGRVDVARAVLRAELGLDAEQPQLGPRLAERAPRVDRQRQVLQRVACGPSASSMSSRRATSVERAEVSRSMPGGISVGVEAAARAAGRGSSPRSSCSGTPAR